MKKKLVELSAENQLNVEQSKMRKDEAGKLRLRMFLVYLLLAILAVAIVLFITRISNNTFRINI